MPDPRTIVELDAVVATLEVLAGELKTLAQGDDWQLPKPRLFSGPAREIKGALTKLKADTFLMAWTHFKGTHGLGNANDDNARKDGLEHKFSTTTGLDYGLLENYFKSLEGCADELALEAILKEARKAVPHCYRFFNPSYGEKKGEPEDLIKNSTVRLELYRDGYSPDTFSMYAWSQLAALDKLGRIVVFGVKPSQARTHSLAQEYRYREDCNGKREFSHGPFIGSQSFKNSRFDLKFKDNDTALDFAHMLVTGQPRVSAAL